MSIDEAIKQLQEFISAYENEDIKRHLIQKYGDLGAVKKDYQSTKVLLAEMERLRHENEQLKTQISILTQANNEAYATISMIRGTR